MDGREQEKEKTRKNESYSSVSNSNYLDRVADYFQSQSMYYKERERERKGKD